MGSSLGFCLWPLSNLVSKVIFITCGDISVLCKVDLDWDSSTMLSVLMMELACCSELRVPDMRKEFQDRAVSEDAYGDPQQ